MSNLLTRVFQLTNRVQSRQITHEDASNPHAIDSTTVGLDYFTERYTYAYTSGAGTFEIYQPTSGQVITNVYAYVAQSFDGTPTAEVGDTNDTNGFLTNTNLGLSSTGAKGEASSAHGVYLWASSVKRDKLYVGAGLPSIDFKISYGGSPSQGQIIIYVLYVDLSA